MSVKWHSVVKSLFDVLESVEQGGHVVFMVIFLCLCMV